MASHGTLECLTWLTCISYSPRDVLSLLECLTLALQVIVRALTLNQVPAEKEQWPSRSAYADRR